MAILNRSNRVPDNIPFFRELIQKFIDQSGEPELTVDDVLNKIKNTDPAKRAIYEVCEGNSGIVCGYLFAEVMPDEYGEDILLVQSTYIDPIIGENIWPQMVDDLEDFGKSKGCHTMYFTTRRNPQAFIRLLQTPWTLDSYVLKHEFSKDDE
jgi:hypothetical protein